jgi:hypothetical protein
MPDTLNGFGDGDAVRVARTVRDHERSPRRDRPRQRPGPPLQAPTAGMQLRFGILTSSPYKFGGKYYPGTFAPWYPTHSEQTDAEGAGSQPQQSTEDDIPCWPWCLDDGYQYQSGDQVICGFISGRWMVITSKECVVVYQPED